MDKEPSQLDKFKQAARGLETDDDPEPFRERVGKLVRVKPTKQVPATPINDDGGLEAEADAMGARAMGHKPVEKPE
jgi:hypothetical protein